MGDHAMPHTNRQYEEELQALRTNLLKMGGIVERQLVDAVNAVVNRNSELARHVISDDASVNQLDIEIEEMCIRLLALRQPAGRDLRFITTGLKINADLERIGDIAVNIAERALELNEEPVVKPYIDIPRMAQLAQSMVKDCIDAFMGEKTELAEEVIRRDDEVDSLNYQIFRELLGYMVENPLIIGRGIRILFVSKYLERIADHASNIGEMVIFMARGRNIRHMDKGKR